MKTFMALVCAGAALAWAQDSGPVSEQHMQLQRAPATTAFVMAEMGPGKTVKNAPYSAQMVTETTQTLADGNRIHHQTTATIMRDSEGRTRNEVGDGKPETVFISDPVAGTSYVLDLNRKTAQKFTRVVGGVPGGAGYRFQSFAVSGGEGVMGGIVTAKVDVRAVEAKQGPNRKVEQLGTRVIEGVEAEGTRVTVTIPAGQIGNDKPIEIVTEKWYSPQLQTTVLTKTSDPRMGETVVKLANISLAEPPLSAFQVPPDYTLEQRK